jgi:hypothetical protein
MAVVGQLVAASVTQHVRVDFERHFSGLTEPFHEPMEAEGTDWPTTLRNEHESVCRVLAPEPAQGSDLVPANWVYAGGPVLDPVDVQATLIKLDLMPLQVASAARKGPMALQKLKALTRWVQCVALAGRRTAPALGL